MKKAALIIWLCLLSACGPAANGPGAQPAAIATVGIPTGPWNSHGLSGRLLFMAMSGDQSALAELDLGSGALKALFTAPGNGRLAAAAVSPDGKQIALAYAPPTSGDQVQLGYSDLYLMDYGAGTPRAVLKRQGPEESYFSPAWSPDGKNIIYAHFYAGQAQAAEYHYDIEQVAVAGGQPQALIREALWPRYSPDGSRLAYLTVNPKNGANDLYLAEKTGANPKPALPPGMFASIDAHLFLPDGDGLLFSAVNPNPAIPTATPPSSWLEQLLGVTAASAHNLPSDWYRVSLSSGQVQRVTNLGGSGLNGALSPDGKRVAFLSNGGLFVMNPDGSELIQLSEQPFVGSLDWIR